MNIEHDKINCRIKGCGVCDTTVHDLLRNNHMKEESKTMEEEIIKYLDERYPNVERWKYEIYASAISVFVKKKIRLAEESLVGRIREEIENTPSALAPSAWTEALNGYREVILSLPSLAPKPKGDK